MFSLSIAGNLPLSDKVSAIRVGEGQITVSTKNNRVIKLSFDKLVIFDDENIQGLDVVKSAETSRKKVLDWFDVRSGMSHNLQKIETGDDFVNKILLSYDQIRRFSSKQERFSGHLLSRQRTA